MDGMTSEEQAKLDLALDLDAQESEAWAFEILPLVSALWADLEW